MRRRDCSSVYTRVPSGGGAWTYRRNGIRSFGALTAGVGVAARAVALARRALSVRFTETSMTVASGVPSMFRPDARFEREGRPELVERLARGGAADRDFDELGTVHGTGFGSNMSPLEALRDWGNGAANSGSRREGLEIAVVAVFRVARKSLVRERVVEEGPAPR